MSAPEPPAPAGWLPDPEQPDQLRYWDGSGWTDHRASARKEVPLNGVLPGTPQSGLPLAIAGILAIIVVVGVAIFLVIGGHGSGDGPGSKFKTAAQLKAALTAGGIGCSGLPAAFDDSYEGLDPNPVEQLKCYNGDHSDFINTVVWKSPAGRKHALAGAQRLGCSYGNAGDPYVAAGTWELEVIRVDNDSFDPPPDPVFLAQIAKVLGAKVSAIHC